MKRFIAAFLFMTMILTLSTAAMAATGIKADMWVEFKKDAHAYNAAKSSKKTNNEVKKGSWAYCDKVSGDFARLIVNETANTKRWFKKSALKPYAGEDDVYTKVIWAKGGRGMSSSIHKIYTDAALAGYKVKVTGHTNLRKDPGMKYKSRGVVEKGKELKLTGRFGYDDRYDIWYEVLKNNKKLWISENFVAKHSDGSLKLY